jgi:predicted O-methyltransferase YrrM
VNKGLKTDLLQRDDRMEANLQPQFSRDWFSANIPKWLEILQPLVGKPALRFLEIGVLEGRATHWLLTNVLTHASARIYCMDTFMGSSEHQTGMSHALENLNSLQQIFVQNVSAHKDKVLLEVGASQELLRKLDLYSFDFVYIDGSHRSADVLEDAILSFRLLKPNGIMIFDDYEWKTYAGTPNNPRQGIDAFLDIFADQYVLIDKWYQIAVRKI